MSLVFDIETGPLPADDLRQLYTEPTYEEFAATCDARWKDETKREKYEAVRIGGFEKFAAAAALSPLTGRVLAIGFLGTENSKVGILGAEWTEAELLAKFWRKWSESYKYRRAMIGWNIHGFDLPFLIRRSWLHGVSVPASVRVSNDKYWNELLIDLMTRFAVGEWKSNTKLDTAAKFFGVGQKPADVSGADFARLWLGSPNERAKAVDYLKNDLAMTAGIAGRMGIS